MAPDAASLQFAPQTLEQFHQPSFSPRWLIPEAEGVGGSGPRKTSCTCPIMSVGGGGRGARGTGVPPVNGSVEFFGSAENNKMQPPPPSRVVSGPSSPFRLPFPAFLVISPRLARKTPTQTPAATPTSVYIAIRPPSKNFVGPTRMIYPPAV